jgi:hypothetical protein
VRHAEDPVIDDVEVEHGGRFAVALIDTERAAAIVELDAAEQTAVAAEAIDLADDLAGIAAGVVVVLLEAIQFFDHREGDHDLVVVEHEDRVGVVQEDVRVQNEVLVDLLPLPTLRRVVGELASCRRFAVIDACHEVPPGVTDDQAQPAHDRSASVDPICRSCEAPAPERLVVVSRARALGSTSGYA